MGPAHRAARLDPSLNHNHSRNPNPKTLTLDLSTNLSPTPCSMRPVRELAGTGRLSKGPIYAVALTKDGKYCLTGGQDKTLRLYNPWKADPISEGVPTKVTCKGGGGGFSQLEEALLIKSYSGPHGLVSIGIENAYLLMEYFAVEVRAIRYS